MLVQRPERSKCETGERERGANVCTEIFGNNPPFQLKDQGRKL